MLMRLVRLRRKPLVGRLAHFILNLYGMEIPNEVEIGAGSRIIHHGFGVVIHPEVTIGRDVTIFHHVTLGRGDAVIRDRQHSDFGGIEVGDGAVLYPGVIVAGGPGVTRIGTGTILAAGAVLTRSTGDGEIWGGVPARKIGMRHTSEDPTA